MRAKISLLFVLAVAGFSSVFTACNKKSQATNNISTSDSLILKSNVIVVDSSKYILTSSASQLQQGVYTFTYSTSFANLRHSGDFAVGNIIVGTTGEGYLRRITSVADGTGAITLNTDQAKLEDIFVQGKLGFNTGFTEGADGFSYTFNNVELSNNSSASVKVTTGSITVNPTWDYIMQFHNNIMNSYMANCHNGTMNASLQVDVKSTGAGSVTAYDTLKTVSRSSVVWISNKVPVIVTTDLYLIANFNASFSGAVNRSFSITNSSAFNIGASYSSGTWLNDYSFTPTSSFAIPGAASTPVMTMTCDIVPRMNVKICGVVGPYVVLPVRNYISSNLSTTSSDWDFNAGVYLQPLFGSGAQTISSSAIDYMKSWITDTTAEITPYSLTKIAGDGQTGSTGQYLPQPLTVKVTDNMGNKQPNVRVYFKVTSGGGNLSFSSALSDANGLVAASWLLGSGSHQTVQASAKKADSSSIAGSPVTFSAN